MLLPSGCIGRGREGQRLRTEDSSAFLHLASCFLHLFLHSPTIFLTFFALLCHCSRPPSLIVEGYDFEFETEADGEDGQMNIHASKNHLSNHYLHQKLENITDRNYFESDHNNIEQLNKLNSQYNDDDDLRYYSWKDNPAVQPRFQTIKATVNPGYSCIGNEIHLSFKPDFYVSTYDYITFRLPGMTSGNCEGDEGNHIPFTDLQYYPQEIFRASYYEGHAWDEWYDSQVILQPLTNLTYGTTYDIVIDASNAIKPTCGQHNLTYWKMIYYAECDVPFTTCDQPTDDRFPSICKCDANTTFPIDIFSNYSLDDTGLTTYSEYNDKTFCHISMTNDLFFWPGIPQKKLKIIFKFTPLMNIYGNDYVNLSLPGFTNGNFSGVRGRDVDVGSVRLLSNGSNFLVGWREGDFESWDKPGYTNSTLILQLGGGSTVHAGELVTIEVSSANNIKAHCGIGRNDPSLQIQAETRNHRTPIRAINSNNPIGKACSGSGYCNKRGTCNLCTDRCECYDGHGSATDGNEPDVRSDCASKICPKDYSWFAVPQDHQTARTVPFGKQVECSGVGTCDRTFGFCICPAGYSGISCERRDCPKGLRDKTCSDRGECLSMQQLSQRRDAYPLSNYTGVYGEASSDNTKNIKKSWDATRIYGCHCDSSPEWGTVGLGNGEIQVSEFFGPACQFRRCPSGDDPLTTSNERNCTNVPAPGGRGEGAWGNLCYVPCSNRGLCDEETGTCSCFDGYTGSSCSIVSELAVASSSRRG